MAREKNEGKVNKANQNGEFTDQDIDHPSTMDVDLEAIVWSDNPETVYFRQLLDDQRMQRLANGEEDYMDDSVLGNNTISELISSNGIVKDSKPVLDDPYYACYQEKHAQKKILDVADKDTSEDSSTEEFEPKAAKMASSKQASGWADRMGSTVKRRRILIGAIVPGIGLLFMIIGLAVLLTGMRGGNDAHPNVDEYPNGWDDDFGGNGFPYGTEIPAPTVEQAENAQTHFLQVLANRSSIYLESLEDRQSPQYRSFEWVTSDPNYFSYGNDRVLQRWALTILGLGLTDTPARSLISPAAAVLNGTWFTYTDECEWYASPDVSETPICNEDGMYVTIRLRNEGLHGEIPSELAVLSNHLRWINLSGNNLYGKIPSELAMLSNHLKWIDIGRNNLHGDIPTEFGHLSNLNRLVVDRNALSGVIPTELGLMRNLLVLEIGHNSLVGPVPEELGEVTLLRSLGMESNALTGTLPQALGELGQLTSLRLQDNELSGKIESRLGDLGVLEHLRLEFNRFSGNVPYQICELSSLVELAADCAKGVGCDCCTECPLTTPPAASLTAKEPTDQQQVVCVNDVHFVRNVTRSGDDVEFEFHNCYPGEFDWVGIYDSDTLTEDIGEPILWTRLCGNQTCRGEVKNGTISFDKTSEKVTGGWPLDKGEYQTFLFKHKGLCQAEVLSQTAFFIV